MFLRSDGSCNQSKANKNELSPDQASLSGDNAKAEQSLDAKIIATDDDFYQHVYTF